MSRQRYEEEIDEILRNAGEGPRQEPPQGSGGPPPRRRRTASPGRRVSVRRLGANYRVLLLAGLVLLVVSYAASNVFVFLASLALLVAGYVVYYRAPRTSGGGGGGGASPGPRMWRGRPIDPDDPPSGRRRR